VLHGIPDLRILPDPYISIEEDRRKGAKLLEAGGSFAGMLDLYYSMTPEIPAGLVPKFKSHDLAAAAIAEATLAELGSETRGPLLDLGCRSGGLLAAAAASRFPAVVGLDAAFRWLVMAQARLREAGLQASLLCANAEYLPFPAASFPLVTAVDLVEHLADPALLFAECRRVAARGGTFYLATNNRYSLLPEPHVNVWGVGWLPARLQGPWVRLASGRDYRNIRLRSSRELARWARTAGFPRVELAPAPLASPGRRERLLTAYNRIGRWRGLAPIAPRLQLTCRN